MVRLILLLTPIFVSLFWLIALAGTEKNHSEPRKYLSKFMLFPLVCFIACFFKYSHSYHIYIYLDVLLAFAISLIFPVYYIYFRLLTIDEKFSLKIHFRFLVVPIALASTYGIGVLFTPSIEFKASLIDKQAYADSAQVQFLHVMRNILLLHFLIQVIFTIIGNYLLIRKYGEKAEKFYSDIEDGKYNNAIILNYSIIATSVASLIAQLIIKRFEFSQDILIYVLWPIFSIMLYILGFMGLSQKPINPTFDLVEDKDEVILAEQQLLGAQKKILQKVLIEFEQKKVHLNSQLNIMHIVQTVGTNRTYISAIINQQYNQNFCSFVNSFRLEELEKVLAENPELNNEVLAEKCGFGSVVSLKRAIQVKTGMSIPEWRNQQLNKKR